MPDVFEETVPAPVVWGAHRVAYAEDQPATCAAGWLRILADTHTHVTQ